MGESVGGERGGHPLFPPRLLVEGGDGKGGWMGKEDRGERDQDTEGG